MSKRVLTRDEERMIGVYYISGLSVRGIMDAFDLGRSTINRVLVRLDIDRNRRG